MPKSKSKKQKIDNNNFMPSIEEINSNFTNSYLFIYEKVSHNKRG